MTTDIKIQPAAGRAGPSLLARLAAAGTALVEALVSASGAARCAREAERLFSLSDAELARLGLRREDVVRHAFARYLGI